MKNQKIKFNAKIKIIIIAFYTIIIFGVILLMLGNNDKERFVDYSDKSYDNEVAINIRETEKRKSKYETASSSSKEKGEFAKSEFSFRITLIKLNYSSSIKDIKIYLSAKTVSKTFKYDEYSTSSKNMTGTTYTSPTTFDTFSTKTFDKITKDGKDVDYLFDETPEELYVKITYKLNNDDETKILTYKVKVLDFNIEKEFKKAEIRDILNDQNKNPKYIDPKEDPVRLRLDKTLASEKTVLGNVKKDTLRIELKVCNENLEKLKFNDEYLQSNQLTKIEVPSSLTPGKEWDITPEIDNIKFEIWGKISSDDENFSNYVKIYSIYGFMSSYRALTVTSATFDESLQLDEIFVIAEGKIHNGLVDFFNTVYKVKINSLYDI